MNILTECKEANLVQIAENVQCDVKYMCNCCSCCCVMMKAIKTFDIHNAIVTSNWIMEIDTEKCTGCGKCVEVCPINAIELARKEDDNNKSMKAICNKNICFGCGVCSSACKSGAISLEPRSKRVFTPETIFDRIALMAIERGKLANLLFEDPTNLSHLILGRLVNILEKSPPFKAMIAIKPLRSAFLSKIVSESKKNT
jgi:ferredoxin